MTRGYRAALFFAVALAAVALVLNASSVRGHVILPSLVNDCHLV